MIKGLFRTMALAAFALIAIAGTVDAAQAVQNKNMLQQRLMRAPTVQAKVTPVLQPTPPSAARSFTALITDVFLDSGGNTVAFIGVTLDRSRIRKWRHKFVSPGTEVGAEGGGSGSGGGGGNNTVIIIPRAAGSDTTSQICAYDSGTGYITYGTSACPSTMPNADPNDTFTGLSDKQAKGDVETGLGGETALRDLSGGADWDDGDEVGIGNNPGTGTGNNNPGSGSNTGSGDDDEGLVNDTGNNNDDNWDEDDGDDGYTSDEEGGDCGDDCGDGDNPNPEDDGNCDRCGFFSSKLDEQGNVALTFYGMDNVMAQTNAVRMSRGSSLLPGSDRALIDPKNPGDPVTRDTMGASSPFSNSGAVTRGYRIDPKNPDGPVTRDTSMGARSFGGGGNVSYGDDVNPRSPMGPRAMPGTVNVWVCQSASQASMSMAQGKKAVSADGICYTGEVAVRIQ